MNFLWNNLLSLEKTKIALREQSAGFVAVFAGDVNTKMYKIKRKHQIKLGLK